MANAKQCDICGKFYAAHKFNRRCGDFYQSDTNLIRLYDMGPDLDNPKLDDPMSFEACPECFNRVKDYINMLKNEIDI